MSSYHGALYEVLAAFKTDSHGLDFVIRYADEHTLALKPFGRDVSTAGICF